MLPTHKCPACAGTGICPVCFGHGTRWSGVGRRIRRLTCNWCAGVGGCTFCGASAKSANAGSAPVAFLTAVRLHPAAGR